MQMKRHDVKCIITTFYHEIYKKIYIFKIIINYITILCTVHAQVMNINLSQVFNVLQNELTNITSEINIGPHFQVAWFSVITYSQYDCTMTWCLNTMHRTLRSYSESETSQGDEVMADSESLQRCLRSNNAANSNAILWLQTFPDIRSIIGTRFRDAGVFIIHRNTRCTNTIYSLTRTILNVITGGN